MGLSEATYTSHTSSRNAKEFLKCVGEELDRATEVLNNLKTRENRKAPTISTASPYEFPRKIDQETLFSRKNSTAAAATKQQQDQVVAPPPPWWHQTALVPLPPPTESPIPLLEVSEYTSTSSKLDLDKSCSTFQDEEGSKESWSDEEWNKERLGIRLLKCITLRRIDTYHSCKEICGTRLLHCPVLLQQDSKSSIASISSALSVPPLPAEQPEVSVLALPPEDIAAVVIKLRQMTESVVELQAKLGKALEAKKIKQKKQERIKNEKNYLVKLTRFN